jgi:hypothetical protein
LKQGGEALLGEVMLPSQREFLTEVARFRENKEPVHWIRLKPRQFVSMTTIAGAVLVGDHAKNAGFNAFVTSNDWDSLKEIDQIFKYFYGKTKENAKKQGRADRFADYEYRAPNGSRITAQKGNDNLGRSGAVTGLLVSEAGYIEDWTETWRSVEPSLSDAWWRYVIMETTLRRNQPGDFRDVIDEAARGKYPPWRVFFTGWWANPHLRVKMTTSELAEFRDICPPYEMELVVKHGLGWDQARWYFNKRIGGMFGSYDAMKEAYPTTKEEALQSATATDFFNRESMKFYADNVRTPIKRMKITAGGLRDFEKTDTPLQPHLELWELPVFGARYRMGADCADSDERIAAEGSENALVCCNDDTGNVVGVYHGYTNSHQFAEVIDMTGRMFNEADLVPEWNNAGRAVIDHLRTSLNYTAIYKRETFKYGKATGVVEGVYGFDTRGHTRGILLDRIQLGVDRRLWNIPSEYVVNCLKAMAKNGGQPVHRQHKGTKPDDGAVALGLTGFGHHKLVEKIWTPKAPYQAEMPAPPKLRSGIRIMRDEGRVLRFNPTWGKWQ